MGQAERDRRRVERLEVERQHMEQKALQEAELLNPPEPAEALNHLDSDVEWGEEYTLVHVLYYILCGFPWPNCRGDRSYARSAVNINRHERVGEQRSHMRVCWEIAEKYGR